MTETDRLPPMAGGTMAYQLAGATMRPLAFVSRWRRQLGDAFRIRLPLYDCFVIVCDPGLTKALLAAAAEDFQLGLGETMGSVLGPNSILALDGDAHLRQRRLLLGPFHGDRVKAFVPLIEEEAAREINSWPGGSAFPVLPAMQRITLRVMLRAIFGARGESLRVLEDKVPKWAVRGFAIAHLPALQRDLGPLSPWGSFLRLRAAIDHHLDDLIAEARRDPALDGRSDVLSMLVRATHEDGTPMGDAEIRDELVTMMLAGHETTALSLSWAIERLRRHPDVVADLVAEVREGGRALRDATFSETQRCRPSTVFAGRTAQRDVEFGGYALPEGAGVAGCTISMHHDERFFDDPQRFDPTRFVDRRHEAFFPFGGGVRRCLGASLARLEVDVVLRMLIERVHLEPTDEPGERMKCRGVTYGPARGGLTVVTRIPSAGRRRDRNAMTAMN